MLVDFVTWLALGAVLGLFTCRANAERSLAVTLGAFAAAAGGLLSASSEGRPWHVGAFDVGSALGAFISCSVVLLLLTATRGIERAPFRKSA
jgi:hypothetical protein